MHDPGSAADAVQDRAFYEASALPGDCELLSKLRSHPLRQVLTEEMHSRKLPPLAAPAQILQMIVLIDGAAPSDFTRHLQDLLGPSRPLADDLRYHRSSLGDVDLVWERHTEFASYTFIHHGPANPTFSHRPFATITAEWLAAAPGPVLRATRIALIKRDPGARDEDFACHFSAEDLVCCDVADGRARLFSDFRMHPEGNGRLLLLDNGLEGSEAAQLVQRVQELGNYRKIALLGLPAAQAGARKLDAFERRLAALTGRIAEQPTDASASLAELLELSGDVAGLAAATRYRMSASEAYGGIVQDRLRSLGVAAVRGHQTLEDFTERRFLPALRTCASFSRRLEDLAERAEWTSGLLRTKIDTALAAQNRDLLASMDRRASAQLRLQQTVEGLSLAAIAYYAIGLFSYATKPLHRLVPQLPTDVALAAAVPFILALVWLRLRSLRRRLEPAAAGAEPGEAWGRD